MTRMMGVLSLGVMAALISAGCSHQKHEEEMKISPSEIPAAVMNSAKARLPGAEVTSAEKESPHGAVVYDLELKQGGRKYEMGSDEWKKLVAGSKFKDMKHFQDPPSKGHLVLQDHTARLEFRNIKIRVIEKQ